MEWDLNQDGSLDLADGLCLLDYLFGSLDFLLPCGDGTRQNPANLALVDGNGDGDVDISDAVHLFGFLFLGRRPPENGTECIAIEGCLGICRP